MVLISGERGIRTPGGVTLNGFQDRRIRPLCHFSNLSRSFQDRRSRHFGATALPFLLPILRDCREVFKTAAPEISGRPLCHFSSRYFGIVEKFSRPPLPILRGDRSAISPPDTSGLSRSFQDRRSRHFGATALPFLLPILRDC